MNPFAVTAEDPFRRQSLELTSGWAQTQERVHGEPLVWRVEVARRPERVCGHQHTGLRPPERDFFPEPAVADGDEVERRDRLTRYDVERYTKTRGQRRAVTVVPVEQLDHSGGRAGRAHTILHTVAVDGVDQPDVVADDERVGAAFEELVDDPAEAAVELVAPADSHSGEITGTP